MVLDNRRAAEVPSGPNAPAFLLPFDERIQTFFPPERCMLANWEHLGALEKAFWALAAFSSVVLLIQMILTFLGMGHGHDVDVNHDQPGETHFQVLSIRSLTAFFAMFGWVGLACVHGGRSGSASISAALIAGLIAMFVVAGLMYALSRLTEDSTFDIEKVKGAQGKVYLPVPGARAGSGKVTVSHGASRELDAVTDGEPLPTGAPVRVKAVLDGSLLLVERL
jgi:hypothetical protein